MECLMADEVVEVSVAGVQLHGYYDAGGWRAFLACLSTAEGNDKVVSDFESAAQDIIDFDESSPTHLFYRDGFDAAASFVGMCVAQGIDTTDPMLWLRAHDAIVGATRLSTCPGLRFSDDETVDDTIGAVALFVDIMSRAACERTRSLAPLSEGTEDEMVRRGWSIRCDIISGRAGAWIAYADDMGRLACAARGANWETMLEAYSKAREESYLQSLQTRYGCSHDAALSMAGFQAAALSGIADALQQRAFLFSFSDGVVPEPSEDVVSHMFDMPQYEAANAAGLVTIEDRGGTESGGYAAFIGFDVPRTIVMWSYDALSSLIEEYGRARRGAVSA
jgi:hypothetical protein